MVAPCPPLETVGLADLFLGRPRSRRYPKFNIRRDIPLSKEDFLSYFLTRSTLWESPRQSRGFTSMN